MPQQVLTETVLSFLADNNLLASFLQETHQIGRCIKASKIFNPLSYQFHGHPTVTSGAIEAWKENRFLSWKKTAIYEPKHFDALSNYLWNDINTLRLLEQEFGSTIPEWYILPFEHISINSDFYKELDPPYFTYKTYADVEEYLFYDLEFFFGQFKYLRKLQSITFCLTNMWGVAFDAYVCAGPHSIKKLEIVDLGRVFENHKLLTFRDDNGDIQVTFPNVKTIILDSSPGAYTPSFYNLNTLFHIDKPLPSLQQIMVNHTDIEALNHLFEIGFNFFPALNTIDIDIWCCKNDRVMEINWPIIWSKLPQIKSLKLSIFVRDGKPHTTHLSQQFKEVIPPNVETLEISIRGQYPLGGIVPNKEASLKNFTNKSPAFKLKISDKECSCKDKQ